MNTGKLNRKIRFFRHEDTGGVTELGADQMSERVFYECWACIEPRTGSLLSGRTADTMLSKTTHKITIRYNPEIDYSCWIMYAGRRFDIDYINDPHLDKRYLELFVQEVVG